MRNIKTFESFDKGRNAKKNKEPKPIPKKLSREYLFETYNIQEVLDILLRLAYDITENPKTAHEAEEDGQVLLIANISFGGGNFASVQFDQDILKRMSVGFDDLAWQFEEPVDKKFFERDSNGVIEMGMDIGVVYNVGTWDPTLLDDDTSYAIGVVSDLLAANTDSEFDDEDWDGDDEFWEDEDSASDEATAKPKWNIDSVNGWDL